MGSSLTPAAVPASSVKAWQRERKRISSLLPRTRPKKLGALNLSSLSGSSLKSCAKSAATLSMALLSAGTEASAQGKGEVSLTCGGEALCAPFQPTWVREASKKVWSCSLSAPEAGHRQAT